MFEKKARGILWNMQRSACMSCIKQLLKKISMRNNITEKAKAIWSFLMGYILNQSCNHVSTQI